MQDLEYPLKHVPWRKIYLIATICILQAHNQNLHAAQQFSQLVKPFVKICTFVITLYFLSVTFCSMHVYMYNAISYVQYFFVMV